MGLVAEKPCNVLFAIYFLKPVEYNLIGPVQLFTRLIFMLQSNCSSIFVQGGYNKLLFVFFLTRLQFFYNCLV